MKSDINTQQCAAPGAIPPRLMVEVSLLVPSEAPVSLDAAAGEHRLADTGSNSLVSAAADTARWTEAGMEEERFSLLGGMSERV